MKFIESLFGFKDQRSPMLKSRNSILKLIIILLPFNFFIYLAINKNIPQPYMDEYFHNDQLVAYLSNNFTYWNNKITTAPGMYYMNYVLSYIFKFGMNALAYARFMNAFVYSNITLVFFLKIYEFQDINENNVTRSLCLAISPTIYFFNFLDYTDTLSLMFMTMAYYYNITNSRKRLLLCSFGAIAVRQNNIIWLGYLAIYKMIEDKKSIFMSNKSIITHFLNIIKLVFSNKTYILKQFKYQILLFFGFIFYMHKYNNGRLVFGDVENHKLNFHPTQILYFSLFVVINLPITLKEYGSTIITLFKRLIYSRHALSTFLFLVASTLIIIDKFTIVHKFILSDNRHYIFYIYKNLLRRDIIRYLTCIIYPLCFIFIFRLIVSSQQKLVKYLVLLIFATISLCITDLVEFRYFTIPLVFLSFQVKNFKKNLDIQGIHWRQSFGTLDRMYPVILIKTVINIIIFYIFIYCPFNNGESRFMW